MVSLVGSELVGLFVQDMPHTCLCSIGGQSPPRRNVLSFSECYPTDNCRGNRRYDERGTQCRPEVATTTSQYRGAKA